VLWLEGDTRARMLWWHWSKARCLWYIVG